MSRETGAGGIRLIPTERERSLRDRLLRGEEEALGELVDVAAPWLLGLVQGMLHDRHEAEEVVQDTFVTLWQRTHLLDPEADGLMPWLMRVARNRAIDRLRARGRWRRKLRRVQVEAASAEPFGRAVEPNEAARPGWHVHDTVHAALNDLPAEQQRVVALSYFEGLTHSEIAGRLDLPIGTVKTRLRLAFDKLRPALAHLKDWTR